MRRIGIVEQPSARDVGERLAGGAKHDLFRTGDDGRRGPVEIERIADKMGVTVALAVATGEAAGASVRRIDHVIGVEVGIIGQIRMELDVHQSAVGVAVHLAADVEQRRLDLPGRKVGDLDDARLLGNESDVVVDPLHLHRIGKAGHRIDVGYLEWRGLRRVSRRRNRVLVVEDGDIGGAREEQHAAVDVDQGQGEPFGRFRQGVVDDRDLQAYRVLAGRNGHGTRLAGVVRARRCSADIGRVGDRYGSGCVSIALDGDGDKRFALTDAVLVGIQKNPARHCRPLPITNKMYWLSSMRHSGKTRA